MNHSFGLLKKVSAAEKIAPAVATCHARRKTGKPPNKAMPMRFKKAYL